jgi:hypothetical protein
MKVTVHGIYFSFYVARRLCLRLEELFHKPFNLKMLGNHLCLSHISVRDLLLREGARVPMYVCVDEQKQYVCILLCLLVEKSENAWLFLVLNSHFPFYFASKKERETKWKNGKSSLGHSLDNLFPF